MKDSHHHNMQMSYGKFFLMLSISFVIMYVVMFLNITEWSHYYTSTTRIYMSILMVAPMALVMMGMMGQMYPNRKVNIAIMVGAAIVFIVALVALRTQTPIADVHYMKAMIPHHSSAILTSQEADIRDPEVRRLADSIIATQEREIAQMKQILERLK